MLRLVVGNSELRGRKLKKPQGFLKPNFETVTKHRQARPVRRVGSPDLLVAI